MNEVDEDVAVKLLRFGNPSFGQLPEGEPLRRAMALLDQMRRRGHRWMLNMDTAGFHLRHVVSVTHDLDPDEKTYRVDRPLGSAETIDELPMVIARAVAQELGKKHRRNLRQRRLKKGRAR